MRVLPFAQAALLAIAQLLIQLMILNSAEAVTAQWSLTMQIARLRSAAWKRTRTEYMEPEEMLVQARMAVISSL